MVCNYLQILLLLTHHVRDLYLRSLRSMYDMAATDRLSYFQISGILSPVRTL
jgi:hypothetical protein